MHGRYLRSFSDQHEPKRGYGVSQWEKPKAVARGVYLLAFRDPSNLVAGVFNIDDLRTDTGVSFISERSGETGNVL